MPSEGVQLAFQFQNRVTLPSEGLAVKPSDGMVTQSDHAI